MWMYIQRRNRFDDCDTRRAGRWRYKYLALRSHHHHTHRPRPKQNKPINVELGTRMLGGELAESGQRRDVCMSGSLIWTWKALPSTCRLGGVRARGLGEPPAAAAPGRLGTGPSATPPASRPASFGLACRRRCDGICWALALHGAPLSPPSREEPGSTSPPPRFLPPRYSAARPRLGPDGAFLCFCEAEGSGSAKHSPQQSRRRAPQSAASNVRAVWKARPMNC